MHSRKYLAIRLLPKLLSEHSPFFRYYSCKFLYDQARAGSARLALWKDLQLDFSYTLECSVLGYLHPETRETVPFDCDNLAEFSE